MLSTSTIDNVRELAVEQVLDRYVQLKKAGSKYKACCPLHNEKTPSFTVDPVKNTWRCYGCNQGGDAIQFVMLHKSLQFIDAVKEIASDHSITIEENEVKGKTLEQINDEQTYLTLLQSAQNEYIKHRKEVAGYLLGPERSLTRGTVIDWQIGYCHDWQVITPEALKEGKYTVAEKFGLVRKSESGKVFDFFHHRITIPIHNTQGQLIGLGGRLLPKAEGPKYVNPVESPVYEKRKTLFGFHKARANFKKHGMACLVEGYFDVIKMHQGGWTNTVATCGTALTVEQAKLLKRFTDTVLILRDGDKAGLKAMRNDIPILAAEQFNIIVVMLPDGEDPDSFFNSYRNLSRIIDVLSAYEDGIEYLMKLYLVQGYEEGSATAIAKAIDNVVQLLALINSQVRREQYIKFICKKENGFNLKPGELTKPLAAFIQRKAQEAEEEAARAAAADDDEESKLPAWVNKAELFENGFTQLHAHTKGYRAGIYVLEGKLVQITNFTIKPLYHIYESSNNRRMVEVDNGDKNAVVEMPSNAFVNQSLFENALIDKGNFQTLHTFSKKHFKLITGWLGNKSPMAWELKTLGWQPEGFFAFSNAVYHDGNLITYDDLGMIKIDDKHYMSLANSRLHKDDRNTDNPYENDLYLSYTPPTQTDFSAWARLFAITYGDNAPYGIAFAFVTLFKDIITRAAKMPMLYCFGPKGAGKSAMAESITWLFFSGKNGEGDLIKGYNLNPGQGTPFSFYNRVERFRNCPILMNEFDENVIEDYKFGSFKAAYDGEGREVGDGDTGKKRKTKIQKVQGTIIIVGQYLSVKDDGSVLSRSITCQFSLERVGNLSKEQQQAYEQLKQAEQTGLSGILIELLKHRTEVQKAFAKEFAAVQTRMIEETRLAGYRIEARLISNYSLMCTATKLMTDLGIVLPYNYEDFFEVCKQRVIAHNRLLKENNSVNGFWKTLEILFDMGLIHANKEIKVAVEREVRIKEGSATVVKPFTSAVTVLYVRFDNVHALYSKHVRERTGVPALNVETLLIYLKEQPYYIGLAPVESFTDKRTSAYAFNYEAILEMGVVLEKNADGTEQDKQQKGNTFKDVPPSPSEKDETPF